MKNSLKNKINYDYENLHETPSEELWEKLERKLDNKQEGLKPNFVWWKYAAAVLLIISISGFFYVSKEDDITNNNNLKNNVVNTVNKKEKLIKNTEEIVQNDFAVAEVKFSKINSNIKITQNKNSTKPIQISTENNTPILTDESLETFPEPVFPENSQKKLIALEEPKDIEETKRISKTYVKADELLFSRELNNKAKEKAKNKNLGSIDISKIKKRNPSLIKIIGITVYSDSEEASKY